MLQRLRDIFWRVVGTPPMTVPCPDCAGGIVKHENGCVRCMNKGKVITPYGDVVMKMMLGSIFNPGTRAHVLILEQSLKEYAKEQEAAAKGPKLTVVRGNRKLVRS